MKYFLTFLLVAILSAAHAQDIGETAQGFTLINAQGEEFTLSDHDAKVVVVFFFGYNCSSCRLIAPSVQKQIANEFADKEDFLIIGIDVWNGTKSQVQNFISNTNIEFEALQSGSEVANSWGTSYDRIVVLDRDGKFAFKGQGVASNHLNMAINAIHALYETETSLEQVESRKLLTIYPNPVKAEANISFIVESTGNMNISIYNMSGQKVFDKSFMERTSGAKNISLNMEALSSGVHFLQINQAGSVQTRRFVKY